MRSPGSASSDSRPLWRRAIAPLLSDAQYRRWRRLQALTGALPVGIFLVLHLATNAVAIAGPEAFNDWVARLDRLPLIHVLEAVGIAAPLLFHVALGILLGNTARGAGDARPYARPWMLAAQRATGGILVVFVIFHVWGIRLAPAPPVGPVDLFSRTAGQLEHPGLFVFYAVGVIAAALHFGIGVHATLGGWESAPAPPRALRFGWISAALLAALGIHAQLAFVTPAARWLELRGFVRGGSAPAIADRDPAPPARRTAPGAPR